MPHQLARAAEVAGGRLRVLGKLRYAPAPICGETEMSVIKAPLAALALALAAGLGGCNLVSTVEPMFGPNEPREKVRDGVWALTNEACEFSDAKPIKDWPDCVAPVVITGDQAVTWDPEKKRRVEAKVVWTLGPPPVAQERLQFDPEPTKPKQSDHIFVYSGFEVLKRDAAGRAVEIGAWSVICGPPRRRTTDGKTVDDAGRSERPFPGIGTDEDCTPQSLAALRGAASASRPYEKHPLHLRWVRDGDH
jgi:hypothetical protein